MKTDMFNIKGLEGKKTLKGEIEVGGAKNAALKMMAASLLFSDKLTLKNVPEIEDIQRIADLLSDMGVSVEKMGKNTYDIFVKNSVNTVLSPEIAKKIRSSVVVTGPLLAREGRVVFPHPGGCVIGARPIDFFLQSFEKMGATVYTKENEYVIEAKNGKLIGTTLFLPAPSVTVTETIMMASVLAQGTTVIKNAALEPEIAYMAEYLNMCGAKISGAGTPTITIKGGGLLRSKKKAYVTMSDRIEAGSFLILAALTAKDITVTKCDPIHLEAVTDVLSRCGVDIEIGKRTLRIKHNPKKKNVYRAVNIKTHEYPGFPTDLQAPMAVFLTQVKGESMVHETIFEGRLAYAESLEGMGADITPMDPHRMLVKGPTSLHARNLVSPDLRAGLAFVLAAIVAKGESVVHDIYNIDRGYEFVEKRLQKIGVDIQRVSKEV